MSIIYRSPIRAYGDSMANEPPYSYFGFTRTISLPDYKAQCAEILQEMERLVQPRVIDSIPHQPTLHRAVERFEVFDYEQDVMHVMIRVAFEPVDGQPSAT